ncbi:hypothetical protein ACQW02_18755 [Humitalea sp. 24SJ18S-53]|uniref:hypothetical protein n=1 Tax=Humitalea sp. 24SJ18S-53 TaxID=3422307 RepID=UPI003D67EE12
MMVVAAALAGCTPTPDMAHDVLAQVMADQQASMTALGRPGTSLASARGIPQPASARQAAAQPGAVQRGTAPSDTAAFVGAAPDTLRRWLGEPRLLRAEGEAQVWLYHTTSCHLDLVLYPEPGGLRVAYAAARASGTERRTEAACLRDIARPPGRAGA